MQLEPKPLNADPLEESLRRQNAVLIGLARSTFMAEGDLIGAIQGITKAAAETLGVERVGVWFYDEARAAIVCKDLYEMSQGRHVSGMQLEATTFPEYFAALNEDRAIAADDARSDWRTREFASDYLEPLGITSMMDAPIRAGGKVIGIVCHEHVGPKRHWTIDEQQFAGSLADFVALAVEGHLRHQTQAELERVNRELEFRVKQRTKELLDTVSGLNQEIRKRQSVEEALRQAEHRYRGLFEHCIEGIFQTTTEGRLTLANPTMARILGYLSADELVTRAPFFPRDHFDDPDTHLLLSRRLHRHGVVRAFECRVKRKDGSVLWIALGIRVVWNTQGEPVRYEGTVVDIHDRKLAEATMRKSEERYRRLVETAQEGIWTLDAKGRTDYVNLRMAQMLGYAIEEMIGRTLLEFVADPANEEARGWVTAGREASLDRFEVKLRRKDGSDLWTLLSTNPVIDGNGQTLGILVMVVDISDRKSAEDALLKSRWRLQIANRQLEHQASFDALTGVANRRTFDLQLEKEFRRATRSSGPLALIMIDVDHFKSFNDYYGHVAGDECLRTVAAAITECVHREDDFVARYGGEEFAVIMPSTDAHGAEQIAERMRARIAGLHYPHERSPTAGYLTISVGVACLTEIPKDAAPSLLIEAADDALYQAKQAGRNRVVRATD
ncbi:MAG: diguanylate cyclase [Planctomycetota bacterium]